MLNRDAENRLPAPKASSDRQPSDPEGRDLLGALPDIEERRTVEHRWSEPVEHQWGEPVDTPTHDALLDQVSAAHRVDKVGYYIQIAVQQEVSILRTNLPHRNVTPNTEPGFTWWLGRSHDCTIVLPDPRISRHHAVLRYHSDTDLQLIDAGSRNGTLLNGQRLAARQPYQLQDGDVIAIGHIGVKLFLV
jgi:hypothetical protein